MASRPAQGITPADESASPANHSFGANRRHPANRSALASRLAQRITSRWRIGPVGITAAIEASRDPPRRFGPSRESPLGPNRCHPANLSLLANRPAQGLTLRRRIGSVGIIAFAGASRDPFRRICPSRESPTRAESAPIRRIGPLWQVGPKDSRPAGESGPSRSSRSPRPAGIRSGDSASPASHPLQANRRHPANRHPLENRPAQGITLRRRLGPVGITAAAEASRDPPRRFGPSLESPTRSESAPIRRIGPLWQVGPPRESRPLANRPVQRITPSSESTLIRRIGSPARCRPRWRIGTIAATEASRDPFRRIAPSGKSAPMANRRPSSESLPRHAGARRGPPLAARQAQGRPDPPSRRKPARALRERVRGPLRHRAVRKAVVSA